MYTIKKMLAELCRKPIVPLNIDKKKFEQFRSSYTDTRQGITVEKLLEYYISSVLLNPSRDDCYVDIAAQDCPFAYWVREKTGAKIYVQDLYYIEKGVHAEKLGSSVSDIPLPAGAVTRMSLHCSLEHLEDDNDILFIKEAQRLLRPGGMLCIVPFYVDATYSIDTAAGYIDDQGQKQLWGIGARFVRIYDPPAFGARLLGNAPLLEPTVYFVENALDIDPGCYVKFVLLFTRK